jgi:hypothetical protein
MTDHRAIHLARAAALAIALVVPTISTPITAAYADNETPAAIEPPYRAAENAEVRSPSCPPAVSASEVLGAGGQADELARKIYRPGVSDR